MVATIEPAAENDSETCEELEIEVKQLRQVLVHLTRLSAIGTTAAMLVHELAQPVTAAANYLAAVQRLILKGNPESWDRIQEGVNLSQECLVRAADLMGSVKDAAASKAFRARPIALRTVVDDVLRLYAVGLNFPVEIDIAPPAARVMGDRVQLAQIFSNLIRNAADACEGRTGRSLSVTASLNGENMVEVRVRDNGPGLPSELTEKLFAPFKSTKVGGLGVGLSICRTIVEQHKGRIWAESLSPGTAFYFTLVPAKPRFELVANR